jgi:tetratricopeptide (TPR) repeat protein
VHYEQGDDAAAIAEAQAAFDIAPTQYFKGWAATYMAAAMARSGQAEKAIAILEHAVDYAEQAGFTALLRWNASSRNRLFFSGLGSEEFE